MISTLEKEITLRFLKARKKDGFLNVISIFSFIGISLGVAVLIIVMSVMNGFRTELVEKIIGFNAHSVIKPYDRSINEDLINDKTINNLSEISSINSRKVLITGMSDGATFSMLAGLRKSTPFTHIAPFSGMMPASLARMSDDTLATDRPVFLVHGTEDRIFPVETAFLTKSELETLKFEVVLKTKNGLGHTYARNEHDSLLNWFDPELAL